MYGYLSLNREKIDKLRDSWDSYYSCAVLRCYLCVCNKPLHCLANATAETNCTALPGEILTRQKSANAICDF